MKALRKIIRGQRGQSLVELALMLPLLLVMGLGTIEVSNIINSYLVLSHLTREGANLISRGTPADVNGQNCSAPDDALDAVISGASPIIKCGAADVDKWRVIYTKVVPDVLNNCDCYVVEQQIVRGSGNVDSAKRVCTSCALTDFTCTNGSCPKPDNIPGLGDINNGHTFYAVEVFYQYAPITPVTSFGVNLGTPRFYERAIF